MAGINRVSVDFEQLLERAERLSEGSRTRRILGIVGAPGAGKSTLAAQLVKHLGSNRAVLIPMDGYHLANQVLAWQGTRNRKGAPFTFDVEGYIALLERVRKQPQNAVAGIDQVIYAPEFRREIDESIAGAVRITDTVPLIITEGNYLLLKTAPWNRLTKLLDESWFLLPDESLRIKRLLARHQHFGRSYEEAIKWIATNDAKNAQLILESAQYADYVYELNTDLE